MKRFRLQRIQNLNLGLEEAWDFFSSPKNLKKITPGYMGFDIVSEFNDEKMYPGMIIEYRVRPKLNIPITWVTEITHVKEPYFFVDEQRFGPYQLWHHKHFFKETNDGVEMTDIVDYVLPYGILGRVAHELFVKSDLDHIFDYRYEVLERLFNSEKTIKEVS